MVIGKNSFYTLSVDSDLNRIFFKIKGSWATAEEVPAYVSDWEKALRYVRPGFTILTDTMHMLRHSAAIEQLHHQVQRLAMDAGLYLAAEIHTNDEAILDQIMHIAMLSGFPLNLFDTLEDAERWLAEVVQEPKNRETLVSSTDDLTQA